jgi:hypothetical protein
MTRAYSSLVKFEGSIARQTHTHEFKEINRSTIDRVRLDAVHANSHGVQLENERTEIERQQDRLVARHTVNGRQRKR